MDRSASVAAANDGRCVTEEAAKGDDPLLGCEHDKHASAEPPRQRTLYHQESFENEFSFTVPAKKGWKEKIVHATTKFSCLEFMEKLFPIACWIRQYSPKKDLPHDVVSGLTVGVMHLPQGLAYAMLALVPPITGLYMAFFPVLVYTLMGTSRHVSMGTLSIVCIMTSNAVLKFSNLGDHASEDSNLEPYQVATAVCLMVGIIQLIMGICRMGVIKMLLSEPLMSGFSTAAAIHVLVSQLANLTGIKTSTHNGIWKIFNMLKDIVLNVSSFNAVSLGISTFVIITLIIYAQIIKPKIEKRCHYPFPIELLYILVGTVFSRYLFLADNYGVKTVGVIPVGLPTPEVPPIWLLSDLVTDGATIAVVAYSINLSMASILAKKGNYTIRANQELIASGAGNIFASFFACVPFAASLSRSLIQQSVGGKTQIASVVSCVFLLLVLLVVGPFFETLPTCVLAGIIVVNLKSMFAQFKDLITYWQKSTLDGIVWLFSFAAAVALDIEYGLGIGVFISTTIVLFYSQQISVLILGHVPGTKLYLDVNRYKAAKRIPGVEVIQVTGGLNFSNKDSFQKNVSKAVGLSTKCLIEYLKYGVDVENDLEQRHEAKKSVVIDLQGVPSIDPTAADALKTIHTDLKLKLGCTLYLANCKGTVIDSLRHYNCFNGDFPTLFPSIDDAVQHVLGLQDSS